MGEGSDAAWRMQCHSRAVSRCRTGIHTWVWDRYLYWEPGAWLEWMHGGNLGMEQLHTRKDILLLLFEKKKRYKLTSVYLVYFSELSLLPQVTLYFPLHTGSPLGSHFPKETLLSLPPHRVLHLAECRIQ